MNNILIVWLSILAFSISIFGCSTIHKKSVFGNAGYDLSDREIINLKQKAEQGDADAALRLSYYYSLCLNDGKQEQQWLEKSAELGNARAQYNLGILYLSSQLFHDKEKAIFWLTRARDNGYVKAQEALDDVNE